MVATAAAGRAAVYLRHLGLHEHPWVITPNPEFTYPSPSMRTALSHLEQVIAGTLGYCVIDGAIGTGKTTLKDTIEARAAKAGHSVADLYRVPGDIRQTETKIYAAIVEELNLGAAAQRTGERALKAIKDHAIGQYAKGKTTVVLIDDAHRLRGPGYSALKGLLNMQAQDAHLVQVILFGQLPEMVDVIKGDKALHSRMAVHATLMPLAIADVAGMLDFRIRAAGGSKMFFADEAIEMIYARSGGVPRVVCTHADRACEAAFRRDERYKMVLAEDVKVAADALLHEGNGAHE